MNGKNLLIGLGTISHKYYEEAENGNILATAKYKTVRKPLLIAAIIGLLMLLIGCAAYFYSLQQLVVIDHTKEVIAVVEEDISRNAMETVPETDAGPVVAEKVLSLQGYEGSPAYLALQEWWEYAIDYTIQNPDLRFSSDYQRPEAYTKYPCYSQDMVDKVDEICSKYGLHLLGKSTFITDADGMEANGLSGVLSDEATPRCFYGHLYEDGSFTASGELELSGDYKKTVQFQMHNIRKDAFYTGHLGLNNMSDYMQWNYKTPDGYTALLALSDRTGLIFVENEGRFVSIIIEEVPDEGMVFTGLPKEKPFLEMVCDCFMFSDLENG
jgi:hypothetical protein